MIGMMSAGMLAVFGLGFFACAAYALIATIVYFFGKR